MRDCPSVEVGAGQWLFHEGEPSTVVYVVRHGFVKIVKVTAEGTRLLLALVGPGDVVGLHGALEGVVRVTGAQACQDVTVVPIARGQLHTSMREEPDIAATLLAELSRQLRQSVTHIVDLAGGDLMNLLVTRLIDLATRDSYVGARRRNGSSIIIELPVSQHELAEWAGMSPRSAATALGVMRRAGIVSTNRMQLVIHDLQLLSDLLAPTDAPASV